MTSTVTCRSCGAAGGDHAGAVPLRLRHRGAEGPHDADHPRAGAGSPRRLHRRDRLAAPRGRQAQFSVAIRTVTIDRGRGTAEYGVGGGIVWDSDTGRRIRRVPNKAAVLTDARFRSFELLETLLYESAQRVLPAGGAPAAAGGVGRVFRLRPGPGGGPAATWPLGRRAAGRGDTACRLLVDRQGQIRGGIGAVARPFARPLEAESWPSGRSRPTTCSSITRRRAAALTRRPARPRGDCDDVVLYNEHGQVTETTIANVVVEKNGRLVTPPVACGLLPGVFRGHLLHDRAGPRGDRHAWTTCCGAPRLFAVNSLRKWIPAVLEAW